MGVYPVLPLSSDMDFLAPRLHTDRLLITVHFSTFLILIRSSDLLLVIYWNRQVCINWYASNYLFYSTFSTGEKRSSKLEDMPSNPVANSGPRDAELFFLILSTIPGSVNVYLAFC